MTNEPTTGEIVRALRRNANKEKNMFDGGFEEKPSLSDIAADRLESQERENKRISNDRDCIMDAFMSICTVAFKMSAKSAEKDTIINELTDRAESAERERDAAIAEFEEYMLCNEDIPCKYCANHSTDKKCFPYTKSCEPKYNKWRGLPQEGEGK